MFTPTKGMPNSTCPTSAVVRCLKRMDRITPYQDRAIPRYTYPVYRYHIAENSLKAKIGNHLRKALSEK